jgi:pyruvate-ferredoxin/flavodoxin oxidoreductase
VPIHEYVELGAAERTGKTPFVWSTDDAGKLIKVEASQAIVNLVQERRKNWRTLQYLAGLDVEKLDAGHHAEMETLKREVKEATEARESSIDSIARAMSELAASSSAPASAEVAHAPVGVTTHLFSAPPGAQTAPAAKGNGAALVTLAEEDVPKCNNCKTCYQEIPELFEKTRIVADGVAKEVGHLIPGALERIKATPELKAKVARVAANCDAEIIHAN